MSTHNIGFYENLTKISFNYHQISSNTHLISSSDIIMIVYYRIYSDKEIITKQDPTQGHNELLVSVIDENYEATIPKQDIGPSITNRLIAKECTVIRVNSSFPKGDHSATATELLKDNVHTQTVKTAPKMTPIKSTTKNYNRKKVTSKQ